MPMQRSQTTIVTEIRFERLFVRLHEKNGRGNFWSLTTVYEHYLT